MFKKFLSMVLIVSMVMVMFTGCGGKTPTEPQEEAKPETEATETTSGEPEVAPKLQETTITYWLGGNPDTLEPGMSMDSVAQSFLENMCDGLVFYDNSNVLHYRAAKSHELSEDGLVYTFHLDENAKWSDGKPVVAGDFEYAWKRLADPAHLCDNAWSFTYIKNGIDVVEGEKPSSDLGVEAKDDLTLVVTLENPTAHFLTLLNGSCFFPIRKDIVESDEVWFTKVEYLKVSNGPFVIDEWKLNEEITLVKNPNFVRADEVKLEKIIIPLIAEKNTAYTAYQAGQIDGMNNVPSTEIQKLLIEGTELKLMPGANYNAMMFKCDKPPFDDVRVRKAFTIAVDRKKLTDVLGKGISKPAHGMVANGVMFDGKDFLKDTPSYDIIEDKANLELAKELMTEAGYPNGEGFPKVDILIDASTAGQNLCEVLVEMWRELGVDISINAQEDKVFMDGIMAGDYYITNTAAGSYLEPFNFFEAWTGDMGMNTMGLPCPEFEDNYKIALQSTDTKVQYDALHKAEDAFMNLYEICPLWSKCNKLLEKEYVKGTFAIVDYVMFENAYIEK